MPPQRSKRPNLRPIEGGGSDPVVLLVDDNISYRAALVRFTCPRHRRICVQWLLANSAEEAIFLLEHGRHSVALVVSDDNLTGMNGSDLLQATGERWQNIKRALISGWTSGEQVMDAPYPVIDKGIGARRIVDFVCRLSRER